MCNYYSLRDSTSRIWYILSCYLIRHNRDVLCASDDRNRIESTSDRSFNQLVCFHCVLGFHPLFCHQFFAVYINGPLMSSSLLHITVGTLNCYLLPFQSGLAYDMQWESLSRKLRQTAIDKKSESNLKIEIVYPEATEARKNALSVISLPIWRNSPAIELYVCVKMSRYLDIVSTHHF